MLLGPLFGRFGVARPQAVSRQVNRVTVIEKPLAHVGLGRNLRSGRRGELVRFSRFGGGAGASRPELRCFLLPRFRTGFENSSSVNPATISADISSMKKTSCALILALFALVAASALDLSVDKGDVLIIQSPEGGYHLYIKKKADIASVLLTETTKDPALKESNYAYRAPEWNAINGDEKRPSLGFLHSPGKEALEPHRLDPGKGYPDRRGLPCLDSLRPSVRLLMVAERRDRDPRRDLHQYSRVREALWGLLGRVRRQSL